MGQLKNIQFLLTVFAVFAFFSCKSNENKMERNIAEPIEEKLTELVHSYVKMLREETGDDELFCIYVERGNDDNDDFYKYRFYDDAILSENLSLPYKYIDKSKEKKFVIFFFDKEKNVPKHMKNSLIEDELWVNLSTLDKKSINRPIIKVHSYPVWDIFICKDDISKYEIIESIYGLEEKEKVTEICR